MVDADVAEREVRDVREADKLPPNQLQSPLCRRACWRLTLSVPSAVCEAAGIHKQLAGVRSATIRLRCPTLRRVDRVEGQPRRRRPVVPPGRYTPAHRRLPLDLLHAMYWQPTASASIHASKLIRVEPALGPVVNAQAFCPS